MSYVESLQGFLRTHTVTKQSGRLKKRTQLWHQSCTIQRHSAPQRSTNDLWQHSKYQHANKTPWATLSASRFATLITAWKNSLESRPGSHSAELGHKHTHNLSGISSTKKHSLLGVQPGIHEACKEHKVSGFKNSQNKKLRHNHSYLSIITPLERCQKWDQNSL